MSFTDVPPDCTHSSRAVHPVLSSPPPPRLTHHAARTHASHTFKPSPPRFSHNGAHSSSSIRAQEKGTFSFFLTYFLSVFSLLFSSAHTASFLPAFFFSNRESCFQFYLHTGLDDGELNGFDKLSLHSSSLLLFTFFHSLPFPSCNPLPHDLALGFSSRQEHGVRDKQREKVRQIKAS